MRTRTNRDSRPGRPRPASEHRPGSAPSTAWLEAQAAFSAPPAAEAPAPAVGLVPVVVRRGRPLEALADRSAASGSEAAEAAAADAARPARVFRVVSAPAPTPAPMPTPGAAVALAAESLEATRRPRLRRTRRSQQAPGVATVISFAPPPGAVLPYREQMARLGELMRAIDEALAVARQARSFEPTLP
ncbi:hypothetical protein [Rubrivivax rivuli]|uniref:Uncharacterized protein n=1 Tax=Rubrivivax rivuli TaxID=1862385 RepID=A0A437RB05_9BURK|nr:hypothetical protein [Rubrivivax rivuli]RVU43923.1 hypothetical protein EOE66_19925 [Rubrivivax rivuli]